MIIELYGSPGAGKTYIKNAVISKKKCQEGPCKKNPLVILAKKMVIYLPSSLKLRKEIVELIGDTQGPYYNNVTLSSCVDNIIMVLFGYCHSSNKIIFMDEGIIHRLISLSINYRIMPERLIEIINYLFPYLNGSSIFYLYVSPEDCYTSIKIRNRQECNIDQLDDESLKNYLDDYKIYCDYVFQKLDHQIVYRDDIEKIKVMIND